MSELDVEEEGQRRYNNDPVYAAVIDAYVTKSPRDEDHEEANRRHRERCEADGYVCEHFQWSKTNEHRRLQHSDGSDCFHEEEEIEEMAPRTWCSLVVGSSDDTAKIPLEGDFEKEAKVLRSFSDAGYSVIGILYVWETGDPTPGKRLVVCAVPHPSVPDVDLAELGRRSRLALLPRGEA